MTKYVLTLVLAALLVSSPRPTLADGSVSAQTQKSIRAANTEAFDTAIKAGDAAFAEADYAAAAASFQKAIELNPGSYDAHDKFIDSISRVFAARASAGGKDPVISEELAQTRSGFRKEILPLYDGWLEKYPKVAMVYWGKGEALTFHYADQPGDSDRMFAKAIEVDPNCAYAYLGLARRYAQRGDVLKERIYLEKFLGFHVHDPAMYALVYAETYEVDDPARYRLEMEKVIVANRNTIMGLSALDQLARSETTPQQQIATYERLRKDYLNGKNADMLSYSMLNLFSLYGKTDPAKALSFAEEMHMALPKDKNWEQVIEFQKTLLEAKKLLAQNDPQALVLLEKPLLKPKGRYYDPFSDVDRTPWKLAHEDAVAKWGGEAKAYKDLTDSLVPVLNSDLQTAAVRYGATLGKSPKQVEEDIWRMRESQAPHIRKFDLARLADNQSVQLSDFHGKAVLVDFWYPG